MFEGKHPIPGRTVPPASAGMGEPLRPVTWSDLVAKLDAARDLRTALRSPAGEGERDASFDPGCARHIAALGDGKPGVNLDDLVNGKAAGANWGSDEAAIGDAPRE